MNQNQSSTPRGVHCYPNPNPSPHQALDVVYLMRTRGGTGLKPVPVLEYWAHPVDQSVSSTTSGPASGTASGGYQTFDLTNSQHPRIRFSRWWCPHRTSARPAGSTREGPLLLLLLVLLLFTRTRLPPMRVRVQALCTKSKWCKSCKSSLRRFLSRLCSCFSVVLIRPHRKTQL